MKLSKQLKSSKLLIVLSVVLLTLTTATSQAQSSKWKNWQFGLKGGVNLIKISGRSFDKKTQPGFVGGVYGEYKISNQWGIQPELNYNLIVGKTSQEFNQIYGGVSFQQTSLSYVSVPIFLTFKPVPELTIMAGPQYGYLASQTTELLPLQPDKKAFAKSDVAIAFGAQLNLGKTKIGLRYVVGVTDVDAQASDTWKLHGLQAYLGYRIF